MVLLLALSAAALNLPHAEVRQRGRASITIVTGTRISPSGWNPTARRNQREVTRKDADGTKVVLRLTEFE